MVVYGEYTLIHILVSCVWYLFLWNFFYKLVAQLEGHSNVHEFKRGNFVLVINLADLVEFFL